MKKLLFLSFALCLFTTVASAQKITEKDLQGKWKLDYFNADGVIFDVVKGKVTISEETKKQMPPETVEQMENNPEAVIEPFKSAYVVFNNNNFEQTMGSDSSGGIYTLVEKDKQTFMNIAFQDGITDSSTLLIKDNKLHITITGEGDNILMIYSRE